MKTDKWDGIPRRKNDIYFKTIEDKIDRTYDFIRGEFGDVGLNGEKIEGRTSEKIRLLSEQVTKQNGRVSKLEKRNIFLDGAAWLVGALVTFAGVLVFWVKK